MCVRSRSVGSVYIMQAIKKVLACLICLNLNTISYYVNIIISLLHWCVLLCSSWLLCVCLLLMGMVERIVYWSH